jgi:hypothetical protein
MAKAITLQRNFDVVLEAQKRKTDKQRQNKGDQGDVGEGRILDHSTLESRREFAFDTWVEAELKQLMNIPISIGTERQRAGEKKKVLRKRARKLTPL